MRYLTQLQQSWRQCWWPILTTNLDSWSWRSFLTTNLDDQPWQPTLTTNHDNQLWRPTSTTNLHNTDDIVDTVDTIDNGEQIYNNIRPWLTNSQKHYWFAESSTWIPEMLTHLKMTKGHSIWTWIKEENVGKFAKVLCWLWFFRRTHLMSLDLVVGRTALDQLDCQQVTTKEKDISWSDIEFQQGKVIQANEGVTVEKMTGNIFLFRKLVFWTFSHILA